MHYSPGSRKLRFARKGITVIEVLVVIGILAIGMALFLQEVPKAREAARRAQCVGYLKGFTMAIHNYESVHSCLPPSGLMTKGQGFDSLSVLARILQFTDYSPVHNSLNFEIPVDLQSTYTQDKIVHFLCPSDRITNDRPLTPGVPFPTNYVVNLGTWMIYDPESGEAGDGPFGIDRMSRMNEITDGTSTTIMLAEVAGFQSTLSSVGLPSDRGIPAPSDESGISRYGGEFAEDTGHASWASAQPLQTGFTTTFRPNSIVPFQHRSTSYSIDFMNVMPGNSETVPTYAAITSRSYHTGNKISGVNCGMMDGSVRWISSSIDLKVWRALGTRAGGEKLDESISY
jgi:type II secretory pathway pseudopilin PulG